MPQIKATIPNYHISILACILYVKRCRDSKTNVVCKRAVKVMNKNIKKNYLKKTTCEIIQKWALCVLSCLDLTPILFSFFYL